MSSRGRIPSLTFRGKLLLAMMTVVVAVTAATLVVTQRSVESTYTRLSRERFATEADTFAALREARLAAARTAVLNLARSVRLLAALYERDVPLLYETSIHELRTVIAPDPDIPGLPPATFFRIVDAAGTVLRPPATAAPAGLVDDAGGARWEDIGAAGRAAADDRTQHIGYVAPRVAERRGDVVEHRRVIHELIVTPIIDRAADKAAGALAIAFPASAPESPTAANPDVATGIWLDRRVYSRELARLLPSSRAAMRLRERLRARIPRGGIAVAAGDFDLELEHQPYRVFYRPLHEESRLPPAYLVGLHSLAEARAEQRRLRTTVLRVGGFALVLGLVASLLLSRTLSVPLRELVAGAGAIGRGDLSARVPVRRRDEVGRLAAAFNDMAEGLALKERYRNVLDVIADKAVAEQLLAGAIALGGEIKNVSVLFCDVRGFTSLTEHMAPEDVIALLNEHMTALTRIVHDHHGIVDKFVGDSVMAIFGAPASGGDDAFAAVTAARGMIDARRRLNDVSPHPLDIGVGIASGAVVAGCMGSEQRMNYTVLGERVNLAARLCAQAGRMEVLIDDETRGRVADRIALEALPPLQLKGFRTPIAAFRLRISRVLATG